MSDAVIKVFWGLLLVTYLVSESLLNKDELKNLFLKVTNI